jgi:hypothetical protein
MCLAGWKNLASWKETLPASHWLRVSQGIPKYLPGLGGGNGHPQPNPHPLAGIRQRIILDQL